ncbi:MAG: S8 family serine peptidase, partial [Bacteroidota bacterium]
MLRFYPIICSLTLLCACLFSTVATAQKSSPILKLKTEGVELPNNLQSFLQSSDVEASKVIQNRYFKLLQFDYLPTQAEKDRLLLSGVQLLEYVPDNAYIASFPINFIRAELGNYAIRSVVDVPRAIRLHPDVVEASIPAHVQFADGIELMVRIHEGLDMRAVENRLKAMGCSIQKALPGLQLFRLRIPEANISELESFAAVSFTEFAPEAGQPEGLGGRTLIRSNVLSHSSRNYTGEGITALVFDDGYVGPHVDFQGRINQQTVPVSFGGFEHADMVSGILAGAGNVNPDGIGMAPGVFLHINSYVNSEYTLAADEWNSFKDVQIFNASYSNGCNAGYTGITRGVDKILYENEGVMQVYSAGNSAASDCRYGAGSPWGTITGGHKQAKNCIANANLYADGTLVESSSRGPAHDGRLKPDLAAHGQGQLSISPNNQYRPGGGTSAASPSTAGLCAQLFEAYEKIYNEPAVAPLIKAALLNTAVDIGNPGPDFSFGWGQAHGGRAANLLEKEQFLKDQIVQGAAKQHNIEVPANVKEARFMVYWADPPAVEGAQIALVNNLDLTVSAPGGGQRLPLILDPTPDVAAITAPAQPGVDALNNVEQVRYTDPQAGTYSVNIAGTSIPEGPQEYFVVYYFLMDEMAITYPLDGDPLVPSRLELVHWEALGNNEPFELSYSLDDGNNWTVLDANI